MQYRKFGKHNFEISTLGFGCMRFPIEGQEDANIKEEESIALIRYAIDHGVDYIDTAYPYHKGNSEILVGKALKDGYREKVKLATKCPVWLIEKYEDFEKYLNEQLEKLQTERIDMYLLHALSKDRFETLKKLNVDKFLNEAVKSGKVKYVGFSFHDQLPVFKEIVDYYPWDFCQIQYNYLDEYYQAGLEGLKYAAAKNLAVIIMEPLKGGSLAKTPPAEVAAVWEKATVKRTPAQWALSWLWNQPEVTTILSGMNALEQIKENIETASKVSAHSFTKEELDTVEEAKISYKKMIKVDCTACGYCMPCPVGVNIPRNFSLYNNAFMYNDVENAHRIYHTLMEEKNRASSCIECGKCETVCPQHLPIRKHLKEVRENL